MARRLNCARESCVEPENRGPTINGRTSEHHSTLSPDGRSLHVTGDRTGGYGGDDLYVASGGADGALLPRPAERRRLVGIIEPQAGPTGPPGPME